MSHWEQQYWESRLESGVPARDRRSGVYTSYRPDPLTTLPLVLSPALAVLLSSAERAVHTLTSAPGGEDLAGLARFLLRSEAIASSRIEGVAPAAKQVALAELAQDEHIEGFSNQAKLVAQNMTVVRQASSTLASTPRVELRHVLDLHAALLPDQPQYHGLRTVQNWIGGSAHHPLDADFVPPTPERVPALMDDLLQYLNGAVHAPLVQAALVHAQFETIHPFTDGNGRVGRALIHTVLARRGLTPTAVLPISLVLATFRDEYVRGLTAFRHDDPPGSPAAMDRLATWLTDFATATLRAVDQARGLGQQISSLRGDWDERLIVHRDQQGRQRAMRRDSSVGQVLHALPSTPVLTATTVERIHAVSTVAANRALNELHDAGILSRRSAGRGVHVYTADDVLDLVTDAERRLASTQFDTRTSAPNRPVPAPSR